MLVQQNFEIEFAKIYPNFTKKLIQFDELINVCTSNAQDLMHISDSTLSNLRSIMS